MNSLGKSGSPSRRRSAVAASTVAALLILGGCDKKPGGQVVAVVGNEEVTQQELRVESLSAAPGGSQDFDAAAPALLQRVIERNLLAEYARDQGLDRGPEYVARRRQLEQTLLASLAARKLAGSPKPADDAAVRKFMADAPTWFAQREKLTLDQLSIPTPANKNEIKALTALESVDAIYEKLRAQGVKVSRGRNVIDTGSIDPFIGKQIVALKDGEVFDLSTNGTTFIGAIISRTPNPTPAAQAAQAASDALLRGQAGKAVGEKVAELRKTAKITYDPAFQPTKN